MTSAVIFFVLGLVLFLFQSSNRISVTASSICAWLVAVFLSLGLIYTAGQETAVRATLASILEHLAPQEQNDIVVVVVLGNSNQLEFLKAIQSEFGEFLNLGVLQVVSPTEKFHDKISREQAYKWEGFSSEFQRSMTIFNMRLAYLMEHSRRLSTFYLQMSSFCRVPTGFLSVIKRTASSITNSSNAYAMFYRRGILSLGALFTPNMVRDLAELIAMFPHGGVAWEIFEYFRVLRSGIKMVPSQNLVRFAKVQQGQKPSAEFYTDLKGGAPEFGLQDAYSEGGGYYWAVLPLEGQTFVMTFGEPIDLSRVRITSGTPLYRDILRDSVLKACDASGVSHRCEDSRCVEIGRAEDAVVDSGELHDKISFLVKCLQMVITKDQKSWVMIRDISLWVR